MLLDFTAGAVIAEEAGCVITDIDGNALTYDGPSSVLAVSRGVSQEGYLPEV
ncbi:MAG: inositol monophosphatase family protein [Lachnospiraceae bacterium]|nr:inositol monophosphatase family protein [Lachnospiraceae bacterium]